MSDKAPAPTDAYRTMADGLIALMRRVDKGKPAADDRAELARLLRESPALWVVAGNLAEQANKIMIDKMTAPKSMKMSLFAGLGQMAAELTQPTDGALEKLLIGQIVGCWLRMSYLEYIYGVNTAEGNFNIAQGTYWERRLSAAQRRYLQAVETLARVRRLQLPALQVNIAERQLNQVNTRG